jgi:hypothetical protein
MSLSAIPVCYNGECRTRVRIGIAQEEWQSISEIFRDPPQSPLQERMAIRRAIARFEQIAGAHTPTYNDRAENANLFVVDGNLDCVDESLNTDTYLRLLQQHGLLHWHKVEARAVRVHYLLDVHFTARISELNSGSTYVVDSWYRDNGEPPYIQNYIAWLLKLAPSKKENSD